MIKQYFLMSIIVSIIGLALAYLVDGISAMWITFVLSVLEVSLSFDNAIVNARVIRTMDPIWRQRFLTWGMLIAVGFMRLLFPLIIVSSALAITPWTSLELAINEPETYKTALESVHSGVMGLGGTFLLMVALSFFINDEKETHWFDLIERRLVLLSKTKAINVIITLVIVSVISFYLKLVIDIVQAWQFLVSSILGLILFIIVDELETLFEFEDITTKLAGTGLSSFIYLELLDSSFSFDGVLGALALTNNIFIIAIGLGIGAMFVRSLTIMLVDKGVIEEFKYLEHGAFYAIFMLAIIMFLQTMIHIPDYITGLVGMLCIGLSLVSSVRQPTG